MDKVIPQLSKAMEALKKINQKDLAAIKNAKIFTPPLFFTFKGMCIILKTNQIMMKDQKTLKEVVDWTATEKRCLAQMDLLQKMTNYSNEAEMEEKCFKELDHLFNDTEAKEFLKEDIITNASKDACAIFLWV